MAGIQIDGVNNKIDFDDDADTSISSATDDTLVIEVGGSTLATATATSLTINDGVTITTADNTDTLTLTSTDADANTGPNLKLTRNSSSPADGDVTGEISFVSENDNDEAITYSQISSRIDDASDGTEDGRLFFYTMVGGSSTERLRFNGTETAFNEGSADLDFRVESNGNANMLFVDGGNDHISMGGTGSTFGVLGLQSTSSVGMDYYSKTGSGTEGNTELFYTADTSSSDHDVIASFVVNQEGAGTRAGSFRFKTTNGGSPSEKFRIAANGDLTATDTSIASNSDSRLKENIADYTYDISKFKQFQAKTFDWKNPEEHNGKTNNRGFIAQEVDAIDDYWTDQIPIDSDKEDAKLITADSDGNHNAYTLKLGKKDAMYISVIQQLITRIEALEDAQNVYTRQQRI